MSPIPEVEINGDTKIEFFSDVEGNWEWFYLYVSQSKVLEWTGETQGVWGPGELKVRPNSIIVYGGDCCDKGTGDMRLTKLLLKLKAEFPKQVFLLMGPRDVSKLRFASEIAEGAETPSFDWVAPWETNPTSYQDYLEKKGLERNRVTKLKWLLDSTSIGCLDNTFFTRKEEIATVKGLSGDMDMAVVESYVSAVDPSDNDPWMLNYLKQAHIMLILGDTLFLHSSVEDRSMGRIPGKARGVPISDLQVWVKELDAWKDEELKAFEESREWQAHGTVMKRSGQDLIRFGATGFDTGVGTPNNSDDFFLQQGNPQLRSQAIEEYLKVAGICRVLAAGDPCGQLPTIVRYPSSGLLWCTCDLSNSDSQAQKLFNPASTRSQCFTIITIQAQLLTIEGQSKTGRKHAFKLHNDPDEDQMPHSLIGRQLTNNGWVRTLKDQGKMVVAVESSNGRVVVEELSPEKASLRLKEKFGWGLLKPFTVPLYKLKAQQLVDGPYLNRNYTDFGAGEGKEIRRSYKFDSKSFFDEIDNYIFAKQGLLLDPQSAKGQKVVENINKLIDAGKRVLFVTNDSRKSREQVFRNLSDEFGLRLADQKVKVGVNDQELSDAEKMRRLEKNIVTSAHTCAWFLNSAKIRKPFVICSEPGLLLELEMVGITDYIATIDKNGNRKEEFKQPVSVAAVAAICQLAGDVDAVVVGWDHEPTQITLTAAVQILREHLETKATHGGHGIPLISCSMDPAGTVQQDGKQIRIAGNGILTQSIAWIVGMEVQAINLGKPSLLLMERLRRRDNDSSGGLGLDFSRTVICGESLDGDITLANRAGIKSLLILSGMTSRVDVDIAEQEDETDRLPTWILDDFASVEFPEMT